MKIEIGCRATDGYETTSPHGPVRVLDFPRGRSRLYLTHAARVIDAKRATEAETAWSAPVRTQRDQLRDGRVLQLTGGDNAA